VHSQDDIRACLTAASSVKAYRTRGWGLRGGRVSVLMWWCGTDILGVDVLDGLSDVIHGNDRKEGPENLTDLAPTISE
jgi:hypothetical protein